MGKAAPDLLTGQGTGHTSASHSFLMSWHTAPHTTGAAGTLPSASREATSVSSSTSSAFNPAAGSTIS